MIFTAIGNVFGIIGASIENFVIFIIGIALAQFFIYLGTGPVGVGIMTCVPPELRG